MGRSVGAANASKGSSRQIQRFSRGKCRSPLEACGSVSSSSSS